MDPAGLVYWVFQQAGVTIPSTAQGQYSTGENVPVGPPGNSLAYVQPGDVIFQATSDPNTETEGIVYSTAGQGTIITSTPGQGVTYVPISGQIDQIRRYLGSNSGFAAAPYSNTTPTWQMVAEDYKPIQTNTSSTFIIPEPRKQFVYTARVYELALIIGIATVLLLAKHHVNHNK
jgi:cell wall-associated NlpC family hydrolase